MGEVGGVTKRRLFRWPSEARELIREYKLQTSRVQGCSGKERRILISKLGEPSGRPETHACAFCEPLESMRSADIAHGPSRSNSVFWISSYYCARGRGSENLAAAGGVGSLDASPARHGRKNGARLVHEILIVPGSPHASRRNTEVDRPRIAEVSPIRKRRHQGKYHLRRRFLRVCRAARPPKL